MNIRLLAVLATAALIAAASWLLAAKVHAQERGADPWQRGGPHKVIDAGARVVSGDDEASVRTLTEDVFNYPHPYGRLPGSLEIVVKDRLTQAEMDYLRGKRPGVKEEDIVRVVNLVADRLHLPEYAKTSQKQVRLLRMSMTLASPVFMGRGMTEQNVNVGDSISPELSPLQAAHLAAVMLDQKFMDPDYQAAPGEWEQTFQQKQIEKLKRQQSLSKSSAAANSKYMIGAIQNPKRTEMRQAFSNGLSTLGPSDALDLIDSVFASFGMKR